MVCQKVKFYRERWIKVKPILGQCVIVIEEEEENLFISPQKYRIMIHMQN